MRCPIPNTRFSVLKRQLSGCSRDVRKVEFYCSNRYASTVNSLRRRAGFAFRCDGDGREDTRNHAVVACRHGQLDADFGNEMPSKFEMRRVIDSATPALH
jgi:hypothetical protein